MKKTLLLLTGWLGLAAHGAQAQQYVPSNSPGDLVLPGWLAAAYAR